MQIFDDYYQYFQIMIAIDLDYLARSIFSTCAYARSIPTMETYVNHCSKLAIFIYSIFNFSLYLRSIFGLRSIASILFDRD
jgi:hypothetical protein